MKFSIRDLLWLTVVVALLVGWYVERRGNTLLSTEVEKASKTNELLKRILAAHDVQVHPMDDGFEDEVENAEMRKRLRMERDEFLRVEIEELRRSVEPSSNELLNRLYPQPTSSAPAEDSPQK